MLDPVTIAAIIILGLLIIGGIGLYLFYHRRKENRYHILPDQEAPDNNQEQPIPTKQNIFNRIAEYIVGKLAPLGITIEKQAVIDNLFGDNPERNIDEDGTVTQVINTKNTLNIRQELDNDEYKDTVIRFKAVFSADQQIPVVGNNFADHIRVIEKPSGFKVTVAPTLSMSDSD